MTPDQLAQLKRNIEAQEGRVPYLYIDTTGNVTTGIGHLICAAKSPNFPGALALPWSPQLTGREFTELCAKPRGCVASYYAPWTRARLSDAAMDALLDQDIAERQQELKGAFRNYAAWPGAAVAAMLDVQFTCGLRGFPHLCVAAAAGDWLACATLSHRLELPAVGGIAPQRNAATKALFLEAASEVKA